MARANQRKKIIGIRSRKVQLENLWDKNGNKLKFGPGNQFSM